MIRTGSWAACAGLLLVASAVPAAAHHSFAMFDASKTTTLDGTIKLFQWVNPHVVIWLDVPGQGGDKVWAFEMTGPGPLRRMGWNPQSLKPGDKVRVTFHPLRDGRTGGQFVRAIDLATGRVLGNNGPLPGQRKLSGNPAD